MSVKLLTAWHHLKWERHETVWSGRAKEDRGQVVRWKCQSSPQVCSHHSNGTGEWVWRYRHRLEELQLGAVEFESTVRIDSIYMCLHVFTCVYCLLNVANPCLQNQALAGALQYQTTTHWTSLRRALYLGQPIVYLHGKKALAVHYYLWLWCLSKANMRLYIKKNLMLNYLRWICLQGQKCFQ